MPAHALCQRRIAIESRFLVGLGSTGGKAGAPPASNDPRKRTHRLRRLLRFRQPREWRQVEGRVALQEERLRLRGRWLLKGRGGERAQLWEL